VFGIPGAGKTTLIGGGPRTLILHPPTDHTDPIEQPSDTDELVLGDHGAMLEAFQWLQQGGSEDYDWVWLDNISLMEDHGMDDVFQHAIDLKPQRAEHGPDKGEYGVNRQRLMKWLRDMVGLSQAGRFNFGVTAHPMEVWDPVQEQDVYVPMVGSPSKGNLSVKLCGYMNVVAYLRVIERADKPTRRVLMTEASGFYGKDQITKGQLNEMANPTMPKIISALNEARPKGRNNKRRPARRRARR